MDVFSVTGTTKLFFVVTGQIGMKFTSGTKHHSVHMLYWTIIEESILKISVNGVILPQNRDFGVVLTDLGLTGLQFRGYVLRRS